MQVYLFDINVSAEIDEYPSLRFQDIKKKKCHGRTHGRTDGCHKQSLRGYKYIQHTYLHYMHDCTLSPFEVKVIFEDTSGKRMVSKYL